MTLQAPAPRSGSTLSSVIFSERGGLQKLIDDDAVTGVTSNPAIFEQAIGHSKAYDTALARFRSGKAERNDG